MWAELWRVGRSVKEVEETVNVLEAKAVELSKGPPHYCVPACPFWETEHRRRATPADLAPPACAHQAEGTEVPWGQ